MCCLSVLISVCLTYSIYIYIYIYGPRARPQTVRFGRHLRGQGGHGRLEGLLDVKCANTI